jgi:dTMP kinase
MCPRTHGSGRLIAIEGVSGVGKTHLTAALLAKYPAETRPVLLEEFSQRPAGPDRDLGRDLLRVLIAAADGDPFLRGGHPRAETLLLLAIKTFDYESCLEALAQGRTVIEGRSLHTIAVYQSLILHPDDDAAAYAQAHTILDHAARWRPLPDLTIHLCDDVTAAVRRAEDRDRMRFTAEHWRLHHRAAALFDRLAAEDPDAMPTIDLRMASSREIVAAIRALVAGMARCSGESDAL